MTSTSEQGIGSEEIGVASPSAPQSGPTCAATPSITAYDAGLLNDWGGGNVEWWQDYIRAELGRAHEFYAAQIEATPSNDRALNLLFGVERFLMKLADAVCGNEQLPGHEDFYRGYNAVTRRVRSEAYDLLPSIRAAIASAEGRDHV